MTRAAGIALLCAAAAIGAGCSTSVYPHRSQTGPKGELYLAAPRSKNFINAVVEPEHYQLFRAGDAQSKPIAGQGSETGAVMLPIASGLQAEVQCVPQARVFASAVDRDLSDGRSAESQSNWLAGSAVVVMAGGVGTGAALAVIGDDPAPGVIVALSSLTVSLGLTIWGAVVGGQSLAAYNRASVSTLDAVNAYNDLRSTLPACQGAAAVGP